MTHSEWEPRTGDREQDQLPDEIPADWHTSFEVAERCFTPAEPCS
ncbi:hypothetical protein FB566_0645 [Stackebrandtia endophytica]|uniref:Uncharacterized protein n=1 Tax=Stackebrandtia endophytica TaxID=1496996 RepID=A0A543ARE8_9ACTN|nr:hypothetical protein FB566_0645 [Stackebrandtia endophytica]